MSTEFLFGTALTAVISALAAISGAAFQWWTSSVARRKTDAESEIDALNALVAICVVNTEFLGSLRDETLNPANTSLKEQKEKYASFISSDKRKENIAHRFEIDFMSLGPSGIVDTEALRILIVSDRIKTGRILVLYSALHAYVAQFQDAMHQRENYIRNIRKPLDKQRFEEAIGFPQEDGTIDVTLVSSTEVALVSCENIVTLSILIAEEAAARAEYVKHSHRIQKKVSSFSYDDTLKFDYPTSEDIRKWKEKMIGTPPKYKKTFMQRLQVTVV